MNLLDLPEEILIMIIKKLDSVSVLDLYNTCEHLRSIVKLSGVVRECHMSMNTMATVYTLKTTFFKDISRHLLELNMCAVPDLCKSWLLPAMTKLKKLKSLNISYTKINILDFLEIYQVCPTLKKVTINFAFNKAGMFNISAKTVLQCQEVFKNFDNIHFVGSMHNLLYSKLPLHVLEGCKLHKLEYTVSESNFFTSTDESSVKCNNMPAFDKFNAYILNWRNYNIHVSLSYISILKMIKPSDYEYIIIVMLALDTYTIYVSDLFKNFFGDNFYIDAESLTEFRIDLVGNVAVLLWNKETTNFDRTFFINLTETLKQYIPCYFQFYGETVAPVKYDWFYTVPMVNEIYEEDSYDYEAETIKRRRVAPLYVLNYDEIFKEKHRFQLTFYFDCHLRNAVSLTTSLNYLRKLTYLSLSGSIRYSINFFSVLFRCSENLVTLNVESPAISPCASHVSRSVPLSRCLKHIRITDKRINFKTLFSSLSQCKKLENIYIQEDCISDPGNIGDPSIILMKCNRLYNFFIEAPVSPAARKNILKSLNNTKAKLGKHNLNIELYVKTSNEELRYNYNPFISVFKLSPIKPL